MSTDTKEFSRTRFQLKNQKDDDRREKKRRDGLLRAIAHAVPELAVALRSSSITCDRGEKNVNVYGKIQRRGGRGARR